MFLVDGHGLCGHQKLDANGTNISGRLNRFEAGGGNHGDVIFAVVTGGN